MISGTVFCHYRCIIFELFPLKSAQFGTVVASKRYNAFIIIPQSKKYIFLKGLVHFQIPLFIYLIYSPHVIQYVYLFVFFYAFSRRFYPKRLTAIFSLYIFFYQYVYSLGIEPTTFCAANTMLYHWATGTYVYVFLSSVKKKLRFLMKTFQDLYPYSEVQWTTNGWRSKLQFQCRFKGL